MNKIQSVLKEEKDLKREFESASDPHDKKIANLMLKSLQSGHGAFLKCIVDEDFNNGKSKLADALFIYPHPSVWRFICIVIEMSEGESFGFKAFIEAMNFYGLRDHRQEDTLMRVAFINRYKKEDIFFEKLKCEGITEDGFNFLNKNPTITSYNVKRILDHARSIKSNGSEFIIIGEFIENFSKIIDRGMRNIFKRAETWFY
jgi:hypothetical protein